ncbi:MAG: 1,6-anhydro-N-acetylmuramyl-L-alanine amidase AmpD [Burkholderiales bacterium]|nr:1,6-anhydro-N-acetylmuramyl-L-alanine amidase AmpD [Burkholderiales bacterium]
MDRSGRVRAARQVPSPNCDARPRSTPVDLLVVHNISLPPGVYGGDAIIDLFLNRLDPEAHPYFGPLRGLRVSAHFLVRRDGELIQFVACSRRAWHAGVSSFMGRARCNDFSIGVELEGSDEDPFEGVQYDVLAGLVRTLRGRYPLTHLVGHSDIAPGRKTDPGPFFDWRRLRAALGG